MRTLASQFLLLLLLLPSTLLPSRAQAQEAAPAAAEADKTERAVEPPPAVATTEPEPPSAAGQQSEKTAYQDSICLMIESAARDHGLPIDFFARVIWRESRFKADAVGPVTRSGERAQGIAQFMPGTAAERRLLDPLNPVQALPKSAEFLQQLRAQFGNLGLAAAAYNAGPRRVREWLDGTGPMPQETRNYVLAITGMTVEDWRDASAKPAVKTTEERRGRGCGELLASLKRAPNPFVEQLQARVKLAALAPWGVQLSAGFSRDKALASYARVMRRFNTILGDRDPSILSSVLRSRGTRAFYQVRIGADNRAMADTLCGRIQRAGGACLVLRNGRGRG
jgi:hypothetical protein